ncbi:MAG TPA: PilN domain-containing protein [Gammaproteobacteria bacterium]|nr:PilN domain-containing protein [Gammaproteobacteria bacterium]
MININLVNWRSHRILVLNRRFVVVVCFAIIVWLMIAGLIYLAIGSQIALAKRDVIYIDGQLNEVAGVVSEIKGLKDQKDLLLSRRKTVEALQASRPLIVLIFDNVVRMLPPGVVIDEFSRKGDEIVLSGTSDSNYGVSLLMENAQKLPWVKSAKIGELKNTATSSDPAKNKAQSSTAQIGFSMHVTVDSEKYGVESETPAN